MDHVRIIIHVWLGPDLFSLIWAMNRPRLGANPQLGGWGLAPIAKSVC